MNFAVQVPPTAVISARTSRCYCNTVNNKMSSIPRQKWGKQTHRANWNTEVAGCCGEHDTLWLFPEKEEPLSLAHLRSWAQISVSGEGRVKETPLLCLCWLPANQRHLSLRQNVEITQGMVQGQVYKLIHLPKDCRDAWEKQEKLETDPLRNRLMGWVHGLSSHCLLS